MAHEAFFKTLNNAGLQRYLLAVKVDTIEVAVEMGELPTRWKDPKEQTSPPIKLTKMNRGRVFSATTASPAPSEFTMLLEMVKGLQAEMKRMQQTQAEKWVPRLQDDPAGGVDQWDTCGKTAHGDGGYL